MVVAPKSPRRKWGERKEFSGPFIVTQTKLYTSTPETPIAEANARLIAAAPDLLKAAKRALAVLKAQGESVRPGSVLAALDEAIAKATA